MGRRSCLYSFIDTYYCFRGLYVGSRAFCIFYVEWEPWSDFNVHWGSCCCKCDYRNWYCFNNLLFLYIHGDKGDRIVKKRDSKTTSSIDLGYHECNPIGSNKRINDSKLAQSSNRHNLTNKKSRTNKIILKKAIIIKN